MKAIFKYTLEFKGTQEIEMPENSEILEVKLQNGIPVLWAIVYDTNPKEKVVINMFMTGEQINPCMYQKHISTIQKDDMVLHFFEVGKFGK